jgi:secondary thiamine-phosphate synthase enzyme
MTIYTTTITENTAGFCDVIDITLRLKEIIRDQDMSRGVATLWVAGSTAALTTMEYEPGLVQDTKILMEKLIPSSQTYHHDERWGDDNGFSHLRASLFGPSLSVPIEAGQPLLGAWQQVVLLDFDNRARTREVVVQLIGESKQSLEKL